MQEKTKYRLIYLIMILSNFLLPISEKAFDPTQTSVVIGAVLGATATTYFWLSPVFHVATILLVVSFLLYGNRFGRIADLFFGIMLLFAGITQHIAYTEDYGLTIITGNLVMISIVGFFWLLEAYKPQNDYSLGKLPLWRYWVVPFAVLAYWFPVDTAGAPNFSLLTLVMGPYGVAFCPTTPVIVALLTLAYPNVNEKLLTITSLGGLIIGIWNMLSIFLMPGYTLWLLSLHIPLVVVPSYGLLISRMVKSEEKTQTQ
ncbi:MAG: hypothetical protein GF309_12100 [Candidatus Lokiarchaeota archaeon]|nr:hypothetical protein [Candidatus Lokiarchaeota archaeon]